jgi:hypothetical protein
MFHQLSLYILAIVTGIALIMRPPGGGGGTGSVAFLEILKHEHPCTYTYTDRSNVRTVVTSQFWPGV